MILTRWLIVNWPYGTHFSVSRIKYKISWRFPFPETMFEVFSIKPSGTHLNDILIWFSNIFIQKMYLQQSHANFWPFCLYRNILMDGENPQHLPYVRAVGVIWRCRRNLYPSIHRHVPLNVTACGRGFLLRGHLCAHSSEYNTIRI